MAQTAQNKKAFLVGDRVTVRCFGGGVVVGKREGWTHIRFDQPKGLILAVENAFVEENDGNCDGNLALGADLSEQPGWQTGGRHR
jgi:hypothetical protein